jgi:hypothetical protein
MSPGVAVLFKHSYVSSPLCYLRRCVVLSRKEGNSLSKLVHSKFWDTTIGILEAWCLLSKIAKKPLGPDGVDVHIDNYQT